MPVQTQILTRRGTAASWTSTNPTLGAGEIGFESDTGKIKIGNGSTAWNALAYTASATAITYLFNATAAQTTFSGADANGLTLAYTVGSEQVYLNGVLQVRGSDYTATNGTSIVLTSGALVSDVLNVISFNTVTITDSYTQAQADAKFFQTANAFLAGKNKIINGDFGIWQRGTSFTTTLAYTADRWQMIVGASGTATVSQQAFTPGTAPAAGYESQYFLRYASVNALDARFLQNIEDVRTFAGQTVTVSFWAKSATSDALTSISLAQNFGSGGSAGVVVTSGSFTLTSSWERYTATLNVPSISGKTIGANNNLRLTIDTKNSATYDFDIWGVQVEAGSIATPFQTASGSIGGELALCQRYYYRNFPFSAFKTFGNGFCNLTTTVRGTINFPVKMRIAPTALEQSGTAGDYAVLTSGSTTTVCSSVPLFVSTIQERADVLFTVASGLTAGTGAFVRTETTGAFLGWSAEL